jgi:predicted short-subunit dehydrogenase-like oxidoreductase (DUF2520 family)
MPKRYKISFIGSGNLATRLAMELENVGHKVVDVCSRNDNNAILLTKKLYNAEVKTDYDFSDSPAEIIIIAVNDDAIAEVAREIVVREDVVLVHTSAAKPLDLLQFAATENTGVFYPLQTFSKGKRVNFDAIPIFLEASSIHAFLILNDLARSISRKTFQVDFKKRRAIHVAAVFACNFTNHLFRVSQEIMEKENLPFDLLKPLIIETLNKSLALGPQKAQTGPAFREDLETLDSHMEYLADSEIYSTIYKFISQDIIDKKND